jgi:hypothetical protein
MLATVTPHQIRDAMPRFQASTHQYQPSEDAEPLPFALRVRCALADYVLHSKEGTLEDRVYGLVAGMPIDVEDEKKSA